MAAKKRSWKWHDVIIDLPPEYYTAIGELLQRWAQLEYQLQEIIWYGMDIGEKRGRTLTVGMGVEAIWGTLKTVMRKWITNPNDQKEIQGIIDKMREYQDDRNYIAHGSWQAPPKNQSKPCLHYMKKSHQRLLPDAAYPTPATMAVISAELKLLNLQAAAVSKKYRRLRRAAEKRLKRASRGK